MTATLNHARAGGRIPVRHARRRALLPYLLLAPAIGFELVIHVVPMLTGIWMSSLQLTKFFIADWAAAPRIGLGNYRLVLDVDSAAGAGLLRAFLVTCAFTTIVLAFSWSFGMIAALALRKRFPGRGVLRTLFLIPYALPVYAGVIAWKFMFQKDTGAVNHLLADNLGILADKPFWLIGENAFWAVVVVSAWRLWPFAFLMLMAGIQSLPDDVFEAAAMDGARPFTIWRTITMPMLRPVNTVLVLVMFLWTFNDINSPFVLFGASQPPAGDLLSFHIYNASFLTWNFGTGAAMSVLLLAFLLLVTLCYLMLVRRKGNRD